MGAPIGNQFWKLRTKHGRDKIFSSPEVLWEEACKYFEWCDENPILEDSIQKIKINGVGEEIKHEPLTKLRAYTWEGLELFLDVYSLRDYKTNEDYKDFSQVISRIEKIIYNQKFVGAASNQLNPNIIARDLGLSDKTESKVEAKVEQIDYSQLSESTLNEIAKLKS